MTVLLVVLAGGLGSQETVAMFTHGAVGAAAANIVITLAGGMAAGLLGAAAARMLQS